MPDRAISVDHETHLELIPDLLCSCRERAERIRGTGMMYCIMWVLPSVQELEVGCEGWGDWGLINSPLGVKAFDVAQIGRGEEVVLEFSEFREAIPTMKEKSTAFAKDSLHRYQLINIIASSEKNNPRKHTLPHIGAPSLSHYDISFTIVILHLF